MYNLNDIITLQTLGFSNEQIMTLAGGSQTPQAQPQQIQAPQAQPVAQPVQAAPTMPQQIQAPIPQQIQAPIPQASQVQPQPVAPQIQQTQPVGGNPSEFLQSIYNLGAAINAQPQPQPQTVQPAPAPQASQGTPLTTEEATKLFQNYMVHGQTQGIELPPNADDVLAKRFMSLYGVDTKEVK